MTKPDFREEKKLWEKGYEYVIGIDEVGRGSFAGPVVAAGVVFEKDFDNKYSASVPSQFQQIISGVNDSKLLSAKKRAELERVIKQTSLYYTISQVEVPFINKYGIGKATKKAIRKTIEKIIIHLNHQKIPITNKKYKQALRTLCHSEHIRQAQCKLREESSHSMKDPSGPMAHQDDNDCVTSDKKELLNIGNLKFEITKQKFFVLVDGFYIPYIKGLGIKKQKAIIKGDQKSITIAAASIIAKVHRDKIMNKLHLRYPRYDFRTNKGYGTKKHQEAIRKHGLCKIHRASFNLNKFLLK